MANKRENDFWNFQSISDNELLKIEQKYNKFYSDTEYNFDNEILSLIEEIKKMREMIEYSKQLLISWQLIANDYRNKLISIQETTKNKSKIKED
ncbi:MAG: hypothetical protein GYA18_04005 [Chloroflexi bacterium]|nr:hypothetical protein [Chloroflexota bacterium]